MSYCTFEGHRVFYTREGAGEPISFLPNATLDSKLWERQIEHFSATHDAMAVDLPGFGRSDRVTPSLELWIRWLDRFIDELDLAPVALVGNCLGSLTVLHYFSRTTPETLAETVAELLNSECTWPEIPIDGAKRSAELIYRLAPSPSAGEAEHQAVGAVTVGLSG